MAGRPAVREAAERDLRRIGRYLQDEAGLRTARKFNAAAHRAFQLLADMPTLGSLVDSSLPKLAEMRLWTIREYRNYVIIYQPRPHGIEVLRIVYGASDFDPLFEQLQEELD